MKLTKDHIARFLRKECTPEEAAYISEYLRRHPEKIEEWLPFEEWQELDDTVSHNYPEEKIRQRIQTVIHGKQNGEPSRSKLQYAIGTAAAAVAIFLGTWILFPGPTEADDQQVASRKTASPVVPKADPVTPTAPTAAESNLYFINSGNGTMRLESSDGSIVLLYPNSEIRFPERFSDRSTRTFELKGKARFEVAKDKTKPFIVHSSGLTTQALGTIFVIDELLPGHATKVSLIEGSIRVAGQPTAKSRAFSSVLKPHEEIVFNQNDLKVLSAVRQHTETTVTDQRGYFEETEQRISFTNMAVSDVFAILQQNYGIHIRYRRADIQQKFYTGSFPKSTDAYKKIIAEINYLHAINAQIDTHHR